MQVLHLSYKSGEADYFIFTTEAKLGVWLAKWCFIHWKDDIEEECPFKEGDEAIISAYFNKHAEFDGDGAYIETQPLLDPVEAT